MNSHHEIRHNGSRKMLALIMVITMSVNMIGSGALYALAEETSQETVQTEKAVLQTEKQTEKPAPQPETAAPQPETPAPQPETAAPQPETPASQPETAAPQPETTPQAETAAQSETTSQTEPTDGTSLQPSSAETSETSKEDSTDGSQAVQEPASETDTEKADETEKNTRVEYRAEISGAKVTVILSDPEAVPDDAELVVEEVPAGADDEIAYHAYFFGVPSGKNKKEAEAGKLNLESGSAQITFQFTNRQLEDRIRLTEAADLVVSQDKDGASDVVPADVFVTEEKVSFTVSYVSTFHFVNQNYKAEEEAETDTEEAAAVETEAETEAETEDSTEAETEEEAVLESTRVRYAVSNDGVMVTAILEDAAAIPDDAELTVTKVTENEACIIYDISFIGPEKDADGNDTGDIIEYEPTAGSVNVTMKFLENQLTKDLGIENKKEVTVVHVPDSGEAEAVEAKVSVRNETVSFSLTSFSVVIIGKSTDDPNPFARESTFIDNGGTYAVGNTVQYLLEHFQIVTKEGTTLNIHCMGSILVGGDLTGSGSGFADDEKSAKTVSSYVGGSVADFAGSSGTRSNHMDLAPLYLGSVNVIEGTNQGDNNYTVNGKVRYNQTDGTRHQGNAVYTNDNYVEWEQLYATIREESKALKQQGATGRPAVSADGKVLTITSGQYVTIESLAGVERINFVGDITTPVNTIINVLDRGRIEHMPEITINGQQPGTGEAGAGTAYVWNFPNAEYIEMPVQNWLGHLIAPDAYVHQQSGQYTGGMICKKFYSAGEGHIYWYNGGKLIGDDTGFAASKTFLGGVWPAGTSYQITMTPVGGAPAPPATSVTLTESSPTGNFGDVSFTAEEGRNETVQYQYTVQEVVPSPPAEGVIYDQSVYHVVITVKYESVAGDSSAKITSTTVQKDDGPVGEITVGKLFTFGFSNQRQEKVTAHFEAKKELSGGYTWGDSDTFDFTLTPNSGSPMPEGKSVLEGTATKTNQTVVFDSITYDSVGTYSYFIKEETPDKPIPGVVYDTSVHTATITIDNVDGHLAVTSIRYDGKTSLTITNEYKASGEASLEAIKEVSGAEWPSGGKVTFTVTAADGVPMPEKESVELTSAGTAEFGKISYTEAHAGKEYTYTISESAEGFGDGWKASPKSITATVKVTDNKNGTLATEVTYDPKDKTITNTYTASGEASLEAIKEVSGAEWPSGGKVTFTVTAADGVPMPEKESVELTSAGTAEFGKISYTEAHAGKEYTYTISESAEGFGDGWKASPKSITATVKVTDNKNGTLATEVTYDPKDKTITNTYTASGEASLEAIKEVSGAEWPSGGKVTFTVTAADGVPMPEKESVELTSAGTAEFGKISYTEAHAGKEYTYTISESAEGFGDGWKASPKSITATVKVTDNKNGTLATEVTYDPEDKTITNSYTASGTTSFKISKDLQGRDWEKGDSFTFTVTGSDGAPMPEMTTGTATKAAKDVTFGPIVLTNKDVGKTYTYKITEDIPKDAVKGVKDGITYDGHTVTVTITPEADGKGSITAEPVYSGSTTFTNVYEEETSDLNINKTFTGAKVKAPDKLSFTVTGPDGYKKTISYSEFTDGKYVLKDLEPGTYKVVENNADIKGYTLKTTVSAKDGKIKVGERSRADIRFVNDYSNVPRTADDTPLLNWIITMVAALYISIIAAYFRRKLLRCV